jgi:hypothetical protein
MELLLGLRQSRQNSVQERALRPIGAERLNRRKPFDCATIEVGAIEVYANPTGNIAESTRSTRGAGPPLSINELLKFAGSWYGRQSKSCIATGGWEVPGTFRKRFQTANPWGKLHRPFQ